MKDDKITKRSKYGYDIFDLTGDIIYEDIKDIENFIINNITESFNNIILNMERVPFVNSSALALLVKLVSDLKAKKIKMYIMNLNENLKGLLKMTGSAKHFSIIKNEDVLVDALKTKELDQILSHVYDEE